MWSFEDQQEYFSEMAQTDNAAHLTLGYKNINMGNKKLEVAMGMPPMQEERNFSTIITSNSYALPERYISMDQLYVTDSGGQRHYADPEYSDDAWRGYMQRPNGTVSDYLTNVFVRPGLHKFEVFPTFATASLVMTMLYSAFTKDLSAADHTAGTITTLANGGVAVVGSSTSWTQAMVGRWLKITDEGNWYKILSVTDSTHLTLLMAYQGTAIAAGSSAYTIGELPRTPEGTHEIACNYALWMHFLGVKRDKDQARTFENLWKEGVAWAAETFGKRYSSAVIPSQRRKRSTPRDPNNYPDLSSLE
jgi:hypothetical protein